MNEQPTLLPPPPLTHTTSTNQMAGDIVGKCSHRYYSYSYSSLLLCIWKYIHSQKELQTIASKKKYNDNNNKKKKRERQ